MRKPSNPSSPLRIWVRSRWLPGPLLQFQRVIVWSVAPPHDRAHARLHGRDVALEVEPLQLGFVEPGVAAVEREALVALAAPGAERRAPVSRVVLRAGQHPERILQVHALETADRGPAQ